MVPARWKIPPTSGTWASPEAWGSPAQGTGLTWHSQSKLEQLRKSPTNPLPQRSSAHLHLVESQLCFFLATACPSHQGQLWQQPQKKPSLCHRSLLATGLNGTGIRRIPSAVSGALAKRRKRLLEQCWTLQTPEKLPGSHAAESSQLQGLRWRNKNATEDYNLCHLDGKNMEHTPSQEHKESAKPGDFLWHCTSRLGSTRHALASSVSPVCTTAAGEAGTKTCGGWLCWTQG